MPEDTQSTTTTTNTAPAESTQGGYVQSILGTAGEFGSDEAPQVAPQPQQAEAQAETDTAKVETAKPEDEKPIATADNAGFDELLKQYAQETGLNPDDPNQRKTLKRLVDKELFIRKLQAGSSADKTQAAADTNGPDLLTAFEKELATEQAPEPKEGTTPTGEGKAAPANTPGKQAPTNEKPKYNDVGDAWKTPEDSLGDLNTAWADNDLKKVHEIEMARLRRNFDAGIAPQLLRYVNQMVEQRPKGFAEKDLGDVVPEVRRGVTERRVAESREFAIDELRKAGANEIDKLFEAEDGPPIVFEGQEFPNTPLNRILAKHPEIMRIVETHPDPAKAERKTFISRYKLAYQIHKQGSAGVSAETARKLVAAGRESKERESNDRARQSINAGPGATGLGEKPANKSYINDLNHLPGEVSFGSLLT